MGRGQDAYVDRLLALVADRSRGFLLDQAQQLDLHDERKVGHLVEEQRSALGRLHQAELVGDRAGKAAAAVAEELAFHELRRDRAAADGHERRVLARSGLVDETRHQFLAGTGFAGDVHGRLAARHATNHRAEFLHRFMRMGLVNRVVAPDGARARGARVRGAARRRRAARVRYTKQAVNKLVKDALNTAFDTATALEIVTFQSEDHREALAALREKRTPVFKGR